MENRLLMAGTGLFVSGLANLFRSLPISHGPYFCNKLFPFAPPPTVLSAVKTGSGKGTVRRPGRCRTSPGMNLTWACTMRKSVADSRPE